MAPKNLWWAKSNFKSSYMITNGCLTFQKVHQIQFRIAGNNVEEEPRKQ